MTAILASACSSVPDIRYSDQAGSTTSSGEPPPPPPPPPDWDCAAGKPPPAGEGICCGTRICLRCAQDDCPRCDQSGCDGTVSAVCCKNKGNGNIQCKSHDGC
jgi:hypothetical protein